MAKTPQKCPDNLHDDGDLYSSPPVSIVRQKRHTQSHQSGPNELSDDGFDELHPGEIDPNPGKQQAPKSYEPRNHP